MKVNSIVVPEEWKPELARLFDAWCRSVTSALTARLTFRDNFGGFSGTIPWNTDRGTYQIAWPLSRPPRSVLVMRAYLTTTSGEVNQSGNAVTWSMGSGRIEIQAIAGLTSSVDYQVDVLVVED